MEQQVESATHVEYPSRKRLILLGFGSLMFVLAGFWMISMYFSGEDTLMTAMVGVMSVLFFGVAFLFYLTHMIKRRPTLQIDDEGIMDNSSLIPGGRIRWEEISEMKLYTFEGQSFIGINLNDSDNYLAEQNVVKEQLMRANKGLVQAHVNIGRQGLSTPLPKLYEEMKRRWLAATEQQTRV